MSQELLVRAGLRINDRLLNMSSDHRLAFKNRCLSLMDVSVTANPRGTFYNSQDEVVASAYAAHKAVFEYDRGIYALLVSMPGVTDWSKQLAVVMLLDNPRTEPHGITGDQIFGLNAEYKIITRLTQSLPITRQLKLFRMLAEQKVNNARTRRLILDTILTDQGLEFHAVKYRRLLRQALEHAWGKRMAGILRAILGKKTREYTGTERSVIRKYLHPYGDGVIRNIRWQVAEFMIAVDPAVLSFILDNDPGVGEGFISAYARANTDFEAMKVLPPEVAEGKRSVFHKNRSHADVLALTQLNITPREKMTKQREFKEAGVEVHFDPRGMSAVDLYIYAYSQGLTDEIHEAMNEKAVKMAKSLPFRYANAIIVMDGSRSMYGSTTQKLRPAAIASALRDALATSTNSPFWSRSPQRLFTPVGDTALAEDLVKAFQMNPDAVYIITDGYENAPAGRVAEVMDRVRRMGITTPVYQFTPVVAAEAQSVRSLSEFIEVIPVSSNLESVSNHFILSLVRQNLAAGLTAIAERVLPDVFKLEVSNAHPSPA